MSLTAPTCSKTEAVALPLADLRIVAIEQFGAGPWATLQLADLGAEVIKIEDPASRGDVGRYVPPYQEGEDSLFFETLNRNKLSVSLDLRHPRGRAVLEALVEKSDALFSNLRGDQPAKLRIRYDDLKHVNPKLVCCSLSGFGMTGPRAAEGGYDYMMQGLAGWQSLTGEPQGPPTKSGLSLVDLSGGYVAAIAMLAAINRARRDGVGADCDVSLFETALAELVYVGTWVATAGFEPARMRNSAHPSVVPFQNFETADGWIVIACAKQKFWLLLCEAMGRPELASDPRFADFELRNANRDVLLEVLDSAFAARTTDEWLSTLSPRGVPCARVNDVESALADMQTVDRGDVVEIDHPRFGVVRQVASPLRIEGEPPPLRRAPFRGEHTAEVLRRVGALSADEVRELGESGVFGDLVLAPEEADERLRS
jgi:crotonobetainyl-CoA:carnitine CoA-transferase CaiB-like acyl-CoA transferase